MVIEGWYRGNGRVVGEGKSCGGGVGLWGRGWVVTGEVEQGGGGRPRRWSRGSEEGMTWGVERGKSGRKK